MASKVVHLHEESRKGILRGVNIIADTTQVTLGPRGRNVLLEKSFGAPVVTKDGVTVVKEIELEDKFEDMGAKMIREVATKTADTAGDGTTTATILSRAILTEGLRLQVAGFDPMSLKRGIDAAVEKVVGGIQGQSRKVRGKEQVAQVGTIAANGDTQIGDTLAAAMERVGREGVITIEEGKGLETVLDVVEGMQFDRVFSPRILLRIKSGWLEKSKLPTSYSMRKALEYAGTRPSVGENCAERQTVGDYC